MHIFKCCEQAVGAFQNVAVALNSDEESHLFGLFVNEVWRKIFHINRKPRVNYLIAHNRCVSHIIFPQASHHAINALQHIIAVALHEVGFPVVFLIFHIFLRLVEWRWLVANHVVAVAVCFAVEASVVVHIIGAECREHNLTVMLFQIVENGSDAPWLQLQENRVG